METQHYLLNVSAHPAWLLGMQKLSAPSAGVCYPEVVTGNFREERGPELSPG